MTIGIDISSLQGPHRMRGIGYTLINLINNLPDEVLRSHQFVLYAYTDDTVEETLRLLNLEDVTYEVRALEQPFPSSKALPGQLRWLTMAYNQLLSLSALRQGDARIKDLRGVDVFLQTDQAMPLPRGSSIKKALILYDIIPYILEWDYMWSYKTARRKGFSRKAALRCQGRRLMYRLKTQANCRRADTLIAISECTKNDFVKYMGIKEPRISVVPLGVERPRDLRSVKQPLFRRYLTTSWGYSPRDYTFDSDDKFLLFVGGADPRRKLDELVTAFNQMRAQGHQIKLVLAGDSMQGPRNISTGDIQNALLSSSYIDDIIFLGFITDSQRDWLYNNALAFVFPSRYEGFGLPVLEAMSYGCPVICYLNSSLREVVGDAALLATDHSSIMDSTLKLMDNNVLIKKYSQLGQQHAKDFSWQDTCLQVFRTLEN